MNAAGVRNIWIAKAPRFQAAPVTKFREDSGQEITELAWTADGSALLFTRGGGANGKGEFPNPRSVAAGVKQEVWIAPVAGGERKLGDGHGARPAPGGAIATYVSGGQVRSVGLTRDAKYTVS
jgi:hypothetical protein